VIVTDQIPWGGSFWTFYAAKYRREDLLARTQYVDAAGVAGAPPGSIVITAAAAVPKDARNATLIREPDGTALFAVFER
jgi:hypothetical protein